MSPNDVEPVDRVKVNLSVDEHIKEQYENAVRREWGAKTPYAGFVLEQELKALLGHGQISDLVDSVHTHADSLGEVDREEKTPVPDRDETERVTYHIAEDLKDRFKREANRIDTVRYPGELLGRVMWRHAEGDGALGRAIDRIERIGDHVQPGEESCKQQRTAAIVAGLEDMSQFTLGDFRNVLDARASGISSSTGTPSETEREYLFRVLDEFGYVWFHGDIFADPDQVDLPEHRHPTEKPYEYMADDEKTRAVKFAALDAAQSTANGAYKFTHSEAKTALAGRPNSAIEWMYQVGKCRGFEFDPANEVLKINADDATAAAENQDVVAALAGEMGQTGETSANASAEGKGSTDEDTTPADDTDEQADESSGDEWVHDVIECHGPEIVADTLPDVALKTAIAKQRFGTRETGEAKHKDRVTDANIETVRERAESLVEESDTADDTDTSDETDEPAEPESDEETAVSERLDTISRGVPANARVATDGGDDSDSDDVRRPMTDGGTVSMLESRSLEPDLCCPRCGGRLRETEQDLTVECTRARCGRRVSLVDVADTLANGPGQGGD